MKDADEVLKEDFANIRNTMLCTFGVKNLSNEALYMIYVMLHSAVLKFDEATNDDTTT